MIDGFRYGFFGISDVDPVRSFGIVCASLAIVSALSLAMLKRGYKLRQ
jgi:ABC-2 type transport system permease protein